MNMSALYHTNQLRFETRLYRGEEKQKTVRSLHRHSYKHPPAFKGLTNIFIQMLKEHDIVSFFKHYWNVTFECSKTSYI